MANNHKDFNCETCPHKHCDKNNPAPFDMWGISGLIDSNICFKPMVTDISLSYLTLYRHYKNNILPFGGGIMDQPYKYRLAMEIIDSQ